MQNFTQQQREALATDMLYLWACGKNTTADTKQRLANIGFHVDFRQADNGAFVDAFDTQTGQLVELEV